KSDRFLTFCSYLSSGSLAACLGILLGLSNRHQSHHEYVGPGTCLQEADMAHSMLVSSMKSNNMGKCVTEKMLARANNAEKTACEVSRGIEVMLVWQKGDRK
ncbi:hypothetical protein ACO22_03379, partial [Paracoccidioides brasiliensis]